MAVFHRWFLGYSPTISVVTTLVAPIVILSWSTSRKLSGSKRGNAKRNFTTLPCSKSVISDSLAQFEPGDPSIPNKLRRSTEGHVQHRTIGSNFDVRILQGGNFEAMAKLCGKWKTHEEMLHLKGNPKNETIGLSTLWEMEHLWRDPTFEREPQKWNNRS